MMSRLKVLVVGATGYIASQLIPAFRGRYDLVLLDTKGVTIQCQQVKGAIVADLYHADRSKYIHYFDGVDVVVNAAYIRMSGRRGNPGVCGHKNPLDNFFDETANVELAYNVYRAAYETGVRRVVVASSNKATSWYEEAMIHERKMEEIDPYKLPLSTTFYGWAKATLEHMGFLFACGAFGRKLEVVSVRIGSPRELDVQKLSADSNGCEHGLGAYFSQRDMCQLFIKSIETANIENEHGIPWHIVYWVSANARSCWSLTNARQVLGSWLRDDSEVKYAEDIRKLLAGPST